MKLLRYLQEVDRRVLYALLLLSVTLPFFVKFRLPVTISPATEALYDTIEKLPEHSFVLLGVDWGAGSRGENGPQTEVLIRHLMQRHLRFALLAFDPQGKTLAETIALQLQKELNAQGNHIQEGTDWVNWGYKVDQVNFIKALVQNIPTTVGADIHGVPVEKLPVMEGIHSANDVKLLLNVNPTNGYTNYIQFMQGPYHIPMGLAPTSVMAAEAFNYLDSHQLVGMLPGIQGATEYEQKLNVFGRATRNSNSLSCAHLLIIALLLMGNIAMVLERQQRARNGGRL